MSVTVRHLNADSTFLLIFSPESNPKPSDLLSANGAYSVLIDPWIVGSSVTTASWFAITDRVQPSCISHLSELDDEPDVVICSQNKQDHTNKETLLQLRPEGKTLIVAEPGAAKLIRSWNHFDPYRIHSMVKYDPKAKFGNSLRLYIPPLSPHGDAGEINIAFIPAKNYITGLHNAFGITYQPPTKSKALAPVSTIDLPRTKYFHIPLSSMSQYNSPQPSSVSTFVNSPIGGTACEGDFEIDSPNTAHLQLHRPRLSRSSQTASSELLSVNDQPSVRPLRDHMHHSPRDTEPHDRYDFAFEKQCQIEPFVLNDPLPTPPQSPRGLGPASPSTNSTSCSYQPSMSSVSSNSATLSHRLSVSNRAPSIHPARPKAVSVLYTPHGLALAELKPYVQNHLVRLPGALPLTLLLHSFDLTQNPWFFGGNIMTGAVGGMEIARSLMARCWLSAHDEPKDDRGLAVKLIKTERTKAEEIRRALASSVDNRPNGWVCDVRSLDVGKEMILSGDMRDLVRSVDGSTYSTSRAASTKSSLCTAVPG